MGEGARFDIVSRTSFGIDLDNPYRFGLKNELTKFTFAFSLAPYQKLTNRVNSPDAVGFIDFTMFHLDLVKTPLNKPADSGANDGFNPPANIGTNRFQTGEFIAGIVKGPWLIQLNAGGNEPFYAPWNKGLQYVNDGIKLSWAYLDAVVDATRSTPITGLIPMEPMGYELIDGSESTIGNDGITTQFSMHNLSMHDRLGVKTPGHLVAVMYNQDTFGLNFKLATQYAFDSTSITEDNKNGIAFGVDSVFNPTFLSGLKIFASAAGTAMYGADDDADPIYAGTKIGYEMPLNEDVSVQPYLGFDMGTAVGDGDNPFLYEIAAGVTMRWPGQAGWFTDYIRDSEGRVFPGMSFGYRMNGSSEDGTEPEHALKFTLFEPRGDDGMFFGLGSEIIIDIANMGADNGTVMATAYFDYTLPGFMGIPGALVPWAIVCYDNLPGTGDEDRINDMKLDIGVKLENAITNTTFGFSWHSGSLIQETEYHWGYMRITAEIRF